MRFRDDGVARFETVVAGAHHRIGPRRLRAVVVVVAEVGVAREIVSLSEICWSTRIVYCCMARILLTLPM